LSKKFPDRPVDGMKKTVFAQVPGQLTVHGWPVVKNKEGFFVKKKTHSFNLWFVYF